MNTPDLSDLFRPGQGAVPPYLAGRVAEQTYFQRCVKSLKNGRSPSRDLILYGPRGNGKTALLRHLEAKTLQKEGTELDIQRVTPNKIPTQAELAHLLKGKHKLKGVLKNVTGSVGTWFGSASIGVDLSASSSIELEDQIRNKCKHKSFILIIDEAHRLQPAMAESLLNASQTVRLEGCPFLLVLAGTPNLSAALGQANASFWDRSKKWPLGRLSPEEAGQALTIPLQEVGITFAPGVIEHIVEQTHCYPFFTQVWGGCLAQKLDETKETVVSMETVNAVEAAVTVERDAMYRVRFNEIKEADLLSVAESVVDAFVQGDRALLHESTLEEAIAQGMADDEPITNQRIMEAIRQLSHLGYVWPVGAYDYEPGIPSLMSFIQEYSLSRNKEKEAEPRTALSAAEQVEQWRSDRSKKNDNGIEL